jgi:hypothetical protein
MQEVRIHKFQTRYRLPRRALTERRRLDELRAAALDEAFRLAFERAGLPEDGELCIRKLHHPPINLRLKGTDASLTLNWARALAEEIVSVVRGGPPSNVVFYHSRGQALLDIAIGVSGNDLRRAWAWRQLGLWRPGAVISQAEAVFELVTALKCEGAMVVPTLRALMEAGRLRRVADQLSDRQWEALAFAALSTTGKAHLLNGAVGARSPLAVRDALRVLSGSRLLSAITSSCSPLAESLAARRAVAALAVLDAEPLLLRGRTAQTLIAIIADSINPGREDTTGSLAGGLEGGAGSTARADDEETEPPDLRQRAFTDFGGLLFLLPLIEELKLPEEILSHAALGPRPFSWVIHQLALALAHLEPDDPAALCFAGLPPNAPPPSAGRAAPSEIESSALDALAALINERLRSLLGAEDGGRAHLLEFVCRRRAEIVADPGWIDVRFSLDDVSTEIRRAGLDLDPGYVSWLGVVVRFVYE